MPIVEKARQARQSRLAKRQQAGARRPSQQMRRESPPGGGPSGGDCRSNCADRPTWPRPAWLRYGRDAAGRTV